MMENDNSPRLLGLDCDPKRCGSDVLAFVGDGVFGLLVREYLASLSNAHAAEQHSRNLGFLEQHRPNMFRDTVNPKIGYAPNEDIPVWSRMDAVRYGRAEVYSSGAWFDPGCTGQILGNNLANLVQSKMRLVQTIICHLEHEHHALPDIKLALVSVFSKAGSKIFGIIKKNFF